MTLYKQLIQRKLIGKELFYFTVCFFENLYVRKVILRNNIITSATFHKCNVIKFCGTAFLDLAKRYLTTYFDRRWKSQVL